jgi:hypothetical protein
VVRCEAGPPQHRREFEDGALLKVFSVCQQLDAYYRLWQVARPEEKPALIKRIRQVVALTHEDRYREEIQKIMAD